MVLVLIGCKVLYSCLYEEEGIWISSDEIKELERRLAKESVATPIHLLHLYAYYPDTYAGLKDRFDFWSRDTGE